jgi:DNA-binding GntR family transcriptional regulator
VADERSLTLRSKAYEELVRMITQGELPPGTALDERALTEMLGVSRTPFREAVAILASDGLVDVRPYRGFSVRVFTRKEIDDLYRLRRTLECFAVRLAVENISNADIAKLEKILDESVAALHRDDLLAYGVHDRAFHAMIAELSDSSPLIETLERLSLQVQMCRIVANRSPRFAKEAAQERDLILRALRDRNADRAAELLDEHIAHVQRSVLLNLDNDAANDLEPTANRSTS